MQKYIITYNTGNEGADKNIWPRFLMGSRNINVQAEL